MLKDFLMGHRSSGIISFTKNAMMRGHILRIALLLATTLVILVLRLILGWSRDWLWLVFATIVAVSDVYDVLLRVVSDRYGYWSWDITNTLAMATHALIVAEAVLGWKTIELLEISPDVAGLAVLAVFCVLQALMAILTLRKFFRDWRHWLEGNLGQKSGRSFPEYVEKMTNWKTA